MKYAIFGVISFIFILGCLVAWTFHRRWGRMGWAALLGGSVSGLILGSAAMVVGQLVMAAKAPGRGFPWSQSEMVWGGLHQTIAKGHLTIWGWIELGDVMLFILIGATVLGALAGFSLAIITMVGRWLVRSVCAFGNDDTFDDRG